MSERERVEGGVFSPVDPWILEKLDGRVVTFNRPRPGRLVERDLTGRETEWAVEDWLGAEQAELE